MDDIKYIFFVTIAFFMVFCGFFVCIFHTIWIDYTKHRNRLIELSFGTDSVYMKERLDYVAAQCLAMAPLFAYTIRYKKDILKSPKRCEFIPTPALHLNKNYLKLLEEFPLYCRFYMVCNLIGFLLLIFSGIVWLMKKYH